ACDEGYGKNGETIKLCPSPPVPGGQGKGEGGIVIRDDALVYKKVHGNAVIRKLKRGDAVVAYSKKPSWHFYEESGRVYIVFLVEGASRGGYMSLEDLAKFTYNYCVFDRITGLSTPPGYPFTPGTRHNWNVCFQEARDAKLKELRGTWAKE